MNKPALLVLSLGLVISAIGTGCAAPTVELEEEVGETNASVIGGVETTGFAPVGMVRMTKASGGMAICTGTLVTSRAVVTAAHCAFDGTTPYGKVEFTFAPKPNLAAPKGDPQYLTGKIVPNPKYTGVIGAGNDAAVILLDAPAKVAPVKAAKAPAVGSKVIAVGYGRSEQGAARVGSGTKRAVSIPVTSINAKEFVGGTSTSGICSGDSGGPVFQNGRLVGINAWVDNAECNGLSHFTRLDDNLDFINAAIDGADGDDGDDGAAAPPPAAPANPPKARACSISLSCSNGTCVCRSGLNNGKTCDGKTGEPDSCSTLCAACAE